MLHTVMNMMTTKTIVKKKGWSTEKRIRRRDGLQWPALKHANMASCNFYLYFRVLLLALILSWASGESGVICYVSIAYV